MAGTNYVIKVRRELFDTNIGARIIIPIMTISAHTNEIASSNTSWTAGASIYTSALATAELVNNTVEYKSPVYSHTPISIVNTDVTIETDTYPRISLKTDTYSMLSTHFSPPSTAYPITGIGFYIVETLDLDWIVMPLPVFQDMYDTDIVIPATSGSFGNEEHILQNDNWISWGSSAPGADQLAIGNGLKGGVVPEPESDPYNPLPPSDPGGGDGDFDFDDSDPIDIPDDPEISAVSTGFVSLWSPNEDQMLSLASYMWNADVLTVNFWKKLIANPLDLIYGLSLVPLDLDSLGYIDGQGTVVVGLIDTGIWMNHLSSQWVTFDCGSINISEAWGAYLDYDPYTKLEIYLPFCGIHPLRIDDFMPGTISLVYKIDLLSGTCVAIVKSTKSNKHGDVLNSVVYQFMGNCAAQIPVTSQQFADAVRSAINIAASIGSMVATGVGGAAAIGAREGIKKASAIARTVSGEISGGASVVENVMGLKPGIERSGAIGSAGSLLSVRTPYLIFTRPRMARPENQNVYTGYPSFITQTLGELNGWTIVQAIHLDNIPCTAEEMTEIDELLKGGVIF